MEKKVIKKRGPICPVCDIDICLKDNFVYHCNKCHREYKLDYQTGNLCFLGSVDSAKDSGYQGA